MFKMQIAEHERQDEWIAFSESRWIENQVLQYSTVGIVGATMAWKYGGNT